LRAAAAAEKGDASTAKSTAVKGDTSTAEFATDNSHRHPSTQPRLTTALMLALSIAGFYDLTTAFRSGTIEETLTFFGPCFLVALMVASLMLHGALKLRRF
jgi:hypothetical protein